MRATTMDAGRRIRVLQLGGPAGMFGAERWIHDETAHALVGEHSGARYPLGMKVEVRLEEGAARRLAANFLGREDEWTVTEPEIELGALELANILCGNALSRLDPGGRFRIEAPRLERRSEEGGPWLAAPLESGRVALRAGFEAQS